MPETIDWDSIRRPIDLPELHPGTPCPRTEGRRVSPHFGFGLGNGPAYPALGPDGVLNYGGGRKEGGWFYFKVLWYVSPDYSGPIFVRGGQLDGSNRLRFNEGADPPTELLLQGGGTVVGAPGWRHWPSYTRVRAPGCYAYQADGQDFSQVIVFQAVEARPQELTPLPTTRLPHDLSVHSGVRLDDHQVRLSLGGADHLVLRLDIGPSERAPLALACDWEANRLDTKAGTVLWKIDPEHDWPDIASWDDSCRRYHLELLDADPGSWSEADLGSLVEAFSEAADCGES
jgi:hypothetical protein